ncbi:tetratricopeptide repeat domain-containing protein [Ditylenchus destructor]|nr:tetratricopeptide repeat domain-containing protein [Ditylenchus destructor]
MASSTTSSVQTDEPMDICEQLDKNELVKLVDEHLQSGDYDTAVFWAEKLIAMHAAKSVKDKLPELARYISVLTAAGKWQMIITFISRHDLFLMHLTFAYFYVNALYNREMFTEIINLPLGYLNRWEDVPFAQDGTSYICVRSNIIKDSQTLKMLDNMVTERKYESRLLFLLAKTYLMVQNRPAAAGCLKHCLSANPFSSEAVHLALDCRLLKPAEIQNHLASVESSNKSGSQIIRHLLAIYNSATTKPMEPSTSAVADKLSSDLSIRAANAFRLYSQGYILDAYKITSEIVHEFGYYDRCFLVHVACLVDLSKISELYALGHSLVRLQPEREITWYTVGLYYYATAQFTTAKKFLNKCTLMNGGFGEGWLAYGHALFYAEEHEQAMNCYLRASRILEGHFEPLLYIAVEYCFANNFKFAYDFLQDAESVAGANAIVLHEQATAAYMKQDFTKAESIYRRALRLITRTTDDFASISSMLHFEVSEFWEPIYNNLGHTLRKLDKYDEAIQVHRKSLLLAKHKAGAWSCIGTCYAALGKIDQAVETLNRALALKPGDEGVKTALEKVLNNAAKFPLPSSCEGVEENLDTFLEQAKSKFILPKKKKMLDLGGVPEMFAGNILHSTPNTTC